MGFQNPKGRRSLQGDVHHRQRGLPLCGAQGQRPCAASHQPSGFGSGGFRHPPPTIHCPPPTTHLPPALQGWGFPELSLAPAPAQPKLVGEQGCREPRAAAAAGRAEERWIGGGSACSPPNSNLSLGGQVPQPSSTQPLVLMGFPASLHPLPQPCLALVLPLREAPRRENPGGLQNCPHVGELSPGLPWLLTLCRPWEDNRSAQAPSFFPDSYTRLRGEFLFIWQKGGTGHWRSRGRVRALTTELKRWAGWALQLFLHGTSGFGSSALAHRWAAAPRGSPLQGGSKGNGGVCKCQHGFKQLSPPGNSRCSWWPLLGHQGWQLPAKDIANIVLRCSNSAMLRRGCSCL